MHAFPGNMALNHSVARLFYQPQPSPDLLVTVVVPVKNETEYLFKTLEALRCQEDEYGLKIPSSLYEVLVLVNNSTDDSHAIAIDYQKKFSEFNLLVANIQLPAQDAHIGTVRSILMDKAYSRLMSVGKSNGIIASTDGDTEVDKKWLFHIMEEIKRGNDAVGGRIFVNNPTRSSTTYFELNDLYRNLVARVESLIDPVTHDPWPCHFQYYGASLAVTCVMYKRAGGLPRLSYLEDEAFYKVLFQHDAKVRRSPQVKVFTSPRLQGRVEIGFSQQLRVWNDMLENNDLQYEEAAENTIKKYTDRKLLRDYWLENAGLNQTNYFRLQAIAKELGLEPQWLQQEMKTCKHFGRLWQKVEEETGERYKKIPPIPIAQAIKELNEFANAWSSNLAEGAKAACSS